MWTTFTKLMILGGLSLLIQSSLASAQIFQWTDSEGVIHFTDNPYLISESIRSLLPSLSAETWILKIILQRKRLCLFPPSRIRAQ